MSCPTSTLEFPGYSDYPRTIPSLPTSILESWDYPCTWSSQNTSASAVVLGPSWDCPHSPGTIQGLDQPPPPPLWQSIPVHRSCSDCPGTIQGLDQPLPPPLWQSIPAHRSYSDSPGTIQGPDQPPPPPLWQSIPVHRSYSDSPGTIQGPDQPPPPPMWQSILITNSAATVNYFTLANTVIFLLGQWCPD